MMKYLLEALIKLKIEEKDRPRVEPLVDTLIRASVIAAAILATISILRAMFGALDYWTISGLLVFVAMLGLSRLKQQANTNVTLHLVLLTLVLYATPGGQPEAVAATFNIAIDAIVIATAALLVGPEAGLIWGAIITLVLMLRTLVVAVIPGLTPNYYLFLLDIVAIQTIALLMFLLSRAFQQTQNGLRRQIQQGLVGIEIGHTVTSAIAPSEVIKQAVQQISSAFDYYHVGLFLVDPTERTATLVDAAGEAAASLKEKGFSVTLIGATAVAAAINQKHRQLVVSWRDNLDARGHPVEFTYERLPSRMELAIPLQTRERVFGVLDIHSTEITPFPEEDIHALEGLAGQISNALESARLLDSVQQRHQELTTVYAQTERRARYLETTAELARVINALTNPQELLDEAVNLVSAGLDVYHAGIFLVDETQDWAVLTAANSEGGRRMMERRHRLRVGKQGIVGQVTHTGQPRIALDVGADAVYFDNPDLPETRSEISLPLKVGAQVIGALDVQSKHMAAFSEEDAAILQTLADQIAIAIENARLFQKTQQALEEIQTLQRHYVAQEWQRLTQQEHTLNAEYRSLGVSSLEETWTPEMELALSQGSPVVLPDLSAVPAGDGGHRPVGANAPAGGDGRDIETKELFSSPVRSALAVPIKLRDEVIGVLNLQEMDEPRSWTNEEVAMATAVADQLAQTLETARLFEEARVRAEEQAALNELGQALTAQLDVDQVLEETYRGASRLLDTTNFYVALYDSDEDEITFAFDVAKGRGMRKNLGTRKAGQGLTEYIIRSRQPLLIEEHVAEWMMEIGIEMIGPPSHSWLGVPLLIGDQVLGMMAVQSYTTPRLYDEYDQNLLTAIASQTSIALQNAHLFEEARSRAERLALVNRITSAASAALNLDDLMETVYREIAPTFQPDAFFIALYDEETNELDFRLAVDEGVRTNLERLPLGGYSSLVISEKKPLCIRDYEQERERLPAPMKVGVRTKTYPSWLGVPMLIGERVLGIISVMSNQPHTYGKEDELLLFTIADQVAVVLENIRLFEEARVRAEELAVLNEMAQALTAQLDVDQVLEETYRGASRLLDTTGFYIALHDAETEEISFPLAVDGGEQIRWQSRQMENGLTEHIIRNRTPLLIPENLSGRMAELGIEMIGSPALSWLGVPLMVGGRVLGVIAAQSHTTPRLYDERSQDLLTAIASQTAIALQNAYLFGETRAALDETEEQARRLALLNEMGDQLGRTANLDEILNVAAAKTNEIFAADRASVALLTPEGDNFEIFALYGTAGDIPAGTLLPVKGTRMETAVREKRLVIEQDERHTDMGDVRSFIVAPLLAGERAIGTLNAASKRPNAYNQRDGNLLLQVASLLSSAIENRRLFEETQVALTETETLAREQVVLNELIQALTARLDVDQVLEETYRGASRLLDTANFYVALYNPDKDEITFALDGTEGKVSRTYSTRQAGKGFTEHIIRSRQPLLIEEHVAERMMEIGIEMIGPEALSWLGAPLLVGDRVLGVMAVQSYTTPRLYDEHDRNLLIAIASQTAIALQNTYLFEEARVRAEELAVLNELAQALTARLNVDQVLEEAYRGASRLVDTTNFYVGLYNPEKNEITFPFTISESEIDRQITVISADQGVAGYMIRNRTGVLFEDNVRAQQEELGIKMIGEESLSWLGVPMIVGDRVLGVMAVQSHTTPRLYDERAQNLLTAIASQTAIALQSAYLFEETERRATQLAAAAAVARDATAILDVERLLDATVHRISEQFDFYHAGVFLLDEPGEYAVLQAASSEGGRRMLERGHRLKVGEVGMVGHVTATGEPRIALDVGADAAFFDNPDLPDTRSAMTLPLKVRERVIGALDVQSTEAVAFSEDDAAVLQTMADQLATAIANARLFEETQSDAMRRALITAVLQAAAASLDPDELLHQAGEVISLRLEAPSAIFTWEAERETLRLIAVHAADGSDVLLPETLQQVTYEMNPTLFEAVQERRTRVLETSAGIRGPLADVARQAQAQATLYVPLISRDQVLGVLGLGKLEGQPLVEVGFVELIAGNLSVALENALLYQEALRTTERLAEVDRLKSQFLANMSHELRTPLNSIIGFSRVVLKGIDGPLTEQQGEDLTAIHNSGQHLLGLINDILDISKIEAGKMELAFDIVDLQEIISGVMSTAIALIKDKQIELQQSIPDDMPVVTGDARRVRQVLINLVSNAAKFTDEGFIHVGAEVGLNEVTISVADSGAGIPPEQLDTIFEPFTQVDASPSRKYGGTGLGLTISSSFIKLHGGQIWVESEVGVGSTFYFTLPIEGPPPLGEKEQAEPTGEETPTQEAPEKKPGKLILCVDDDEGVITLFRRYLHKQGYRVVGLTDVTHVVEEVKRVRPHAITLDVMMPNKDGWQVIHELKADPETRHIPVIMCTIVGEKDRGMSLGAADYLVKPIMEQDLLMALDRLDREAGHHRVLVVDDHLEDRELLRRIIESQDGYEVTEAASGQEAIALVQQTRPHIIVLDLMMPEVDGFAVLESLKADKATRFIPIIVVTAKDLTVEERQILNSSIEALIQKGVLEQEELLEDVVAALRKLDRPPVESKVPDPQPQI